MYVISEHMDIIERRVGGFVRGAEKNGFYRGFYRPEETGFGHSFGQVLDMPYFFLILTKD